MVAGGALSAWPLFPALCPLLLGWSFVPTIFCTQLKRDAPNEEGGRFFLLHFYKNVYSLFFDKTK
jgi:hypothetical protein